MNPIPARFQRAGSSKVVGCLVYLVVAPFVALSLALFLAVPLMYALEAFGVSRDRASAPFVVLLPLCGVGVAVWGYRDYRRRAALEVVIDRDRVTIGIDREGLRRFSDAPATPTSWNRLERIQSDLIGLVLRSREGQVFALSSLTEDFWPALRWIDARVR